MWMSGKHTGTKIYNIPNTTKQCGSVTGAHAETMALALVLVLVLFGIDIFLFPNTRKNTMVTIF